MSSAERPYHCRICRRSFGSYGSLRRHMDEHTPPRRCRNCGKQLRDNEYHRC
jgi:DNA-directed RNA polymerase subunit RPC12/RpoP